VCCCRRSHPPFWQTIPASALPATGKGFVSVDITAAVVAALQSGTNLNIAIETATRRDSRTREQERPVPSNTERKSTSRPDAEHTEHRDHGSARAAARHGLDSGGGLHDG